MKKMIPLLATAVICVILLLAGWWRYGEAFVSMAALLNLLTDNAYLGVIAVGMTFVILTAGIDLSVGSVMGLTTIVIADLVTNHGYGPWMAIPAGLAVGTVIGLVMGCIIQFFEIEPFLVTLGGLFFARGLGFLISTESIGIDSSTSPAYSHLSELMWDVHAGKQFGTISLSAIVMVALVIIAMFIARWTRFGRCVYAIGGNEQSARLMGLPVARTKILVYGFSGFCASLGGVLMTLYKNSGDPLAGTGRELDVIAAVVIGGTLLTGGVGYVFGTLLGIMVLGIINVALTWENLSSWWASIATGALLFIFILLQKLITGTTGLRRQIGVK